MTCLSASILFLCDVSDLSFKRVGLYPHPLKNGLVMWLTLVNGTLANTMQTKAWKALVHWGSLSFWAWNLRQATEWTTWANLLKDGRKLGSCPPASQPAIKLGEATQDHAVTVKHTNLPQMHENVQKRSDKLAQAKTTIQLTHGIIN